MEVDSGVVTKEHGTEGIRYTLLVVAFAMAAVCATALQCRPGDATAGSGGAKSKTKAPKAEANKGFTDAQYKKKLAKVRKKAPKGFTVVLQKPFVVAGDEDPATVKKRAKGTVKWAVDMLKQDFFDKDPDRIIEIWLFGGDASYMEHAKSLFGDEPDTPYGYYSEKQGALVMNIATGGGTLVHEIVHPFMAANFPECPPWLNEGMGSLYEQSAERDGHIVGLTNWRLAGLQEGIEAGETVTFEKLTSMDDAAFYGEGSGMNYAQARYLCYWLQQKGKLVEFFHAFRAAHEDDPTGYETLKTTLVIDDAAEFEKTWSEWVLGLVFDPA